LEWKNILCFLQPFGTCFGNFVRNFERKSDNPDCKKKVKDVLSCQTTGKNYNFARCLFYVERKQQENFRFKIQQKELSFAGLAIRFVLLTSVYLQSLGVVATKNTSQNTAN
jgi:hypothetical protein